MKQSDIEILKNLSYEQACKVCPAINQEDFWQLKSIINESIQPDNYESIYEALADALDLLVEQNKIIYKSMKSMARDMKIDEVLGKSKDIQSNIDEDDFFDGIL